MLDGRLRASVARALGPMGNALQRVGIGPDFLTVIGLLASICTALLIASGFLVWAVVALVISGLTDLLDGVVARNSGKATPRGAFFDSVSDRISDCLVFGGVAWYLAGESAYLPILAMCAASLAMLISYERARAEALGYSAKGGIMERAERMVMLGVGLAFNVLVPLLWIMVVLMTITAVHRFIKVWRQASDLPPLPRLLTYRPQSALGRPRSEGPRSAVIARWREPRPGAVQRREARAARRSRP